MSCTAILLSAWLCGTPVAVDGDTLKFGRNQYVRLWGVDAEELSERNGPRAKVGLQEIIRGRPVKCNIVTIDKYGRHVGRCYVDSMEINKSVVAQGFSLDCRRYSGGAYASVEPVGVRSRLKQKPYCKT